MKYLKFLIIFYVIVVLFINALSLIPKFKINGDTNFNFTKAYKINNILDNPLNNPIENIRTDQYDVEIGKDGDYIALYKYNNLSCYDYEEKCDHYHYQNSSTMISKFDEQFNELSTIGGPATTNVLNFVHNNIFYSPFSLAELDNGNIVAFGKAVDLEDEKLHSSIFVMNSDLEIVDSVFLNLSDYQFNNHSSGLEYFEVVNTDDNGFTVKYTDNSKGSVLIHFNNQLEEEWHIKYESTESCGNLSNDTDTLFYSNNTYYVINQKQPLNDRECTIYSYDKNGNQNWKQSYHFYIASMNVIGNDIIISGYETGLYKQTKNLLFKDNLQLVNSIFTAKINSENGSIEWKSNYYYKSNFGILKTIKDGEGNYYTISEKESRFDKSYNMLILKYDKSGNYAGQSLLKGPSNSYESYDKIIWNIKTFITLIDNKIQIIMPNTSIYREVKLNNITFTDTMPISITPSFNNTLVSIRLFLNRLTAGFIIVGIGYATFILIRKKRRNNE